MQEYTFIFNNLFAQETEFDVVVDETIPLMEALLTVVKQSSGTPEEIPTTRVWAVTGELIDVRWGFAWTGPDEDVEEELVGHLSLLDQGVLPGAQIIARDANDTGGEDHPMDWRERLVHDRKMLHLMVQRNSSYLSVLKASPRTVDIGLTGIRAVVGLDIDGLPRYGDDHMLRIIMPPRYPYEAPSAIPLTPVFHPNVCLSGSERSACYTDEYRPDGSDTLSWIVSRYVSMIQYKLYNLEEPHRRLNDAASSWLEQRLQDRAVTFPIHPTISIRSGSPLRVDLRPTEESNGGSR